MIDSYLVDDIIIIISGGYDSWNEPLADTEIEAKGKVEYKTRLVRNIKGEEVVSPMSVILRSLIEVDIGRSLSHEDRIEYLGIEHSIIDIGKPKGWFDSYLIEVFLG